MHDWVKKLGQWHMAAQGASETYCGSPMLGKNYAWELDIDERTPCADCMDTMGLVYSIDEIHEAFGLI